MMTIGSFALSCPYDYGCLKAYLRYWYVSLERLLQPVFPQGPFLWKKKQVYSLPFNTLWLTFLNKIILLSILMKREHLISKIFSFINSVVPNAPFLYPLKTSENLTVFWYFQRIEIGWIWNKWVNLQKFLALCTQFSLRSFFFSIGDKCYIFRFIHESMIERGLQLRFRF